MSREKDVSRKARKERKGKTTCYQALVFNPSGLGFYLFKVFEFLCGLCDSARDNTVLGL
jgi:hypothetical protein